MINGTRRQVHQWKERLASPVERNAPGGEAPPPEQWKTSKQKANKQVQVDMMLVLREQTNAAESGCSSDCVCCSKTLPSLRVLENILYGAPYNAYTLQ